MELLAEQVDYCFNNNLPQELYLHILFLADDINVTKKLRILTKLSLKATDEYHRILLNTKINIHFNVNEWKISDLDNTQLQESIKKKEIADHSCLLIGSTVEFFDRPAAFKTTIKN